MREAVYISRNKNEIAINQLVELLQKTEWAADRDVGLIEKSVEL